MKENCIPNDRSETILVVEDDLEMLKTLKDIFASHGYNVIGVNNAEKALETIYTIAPHIIILDIMLPGMDGFSLCKIIRKDIMLSHIPIIIITGCKKNVRSRIEGLQEGAIDYILKPFEPLELLAKIITILRCAYYQIDANPLTKLPGNSSCIAAIESRMALKKTFAVCYADLSNFKLYNNAYGFEQGDRVIKFTAEIIKQSIDELKIKNSFVGHLGGDDFVIIVDPVEAGKMCPRIIKHFEKNIQMFYAEVDKIKQFITHRDRRGNVHKTPIMTMSIAVVHNKKRPLTHVGQVSKIADELKSYMKSLKGSHFIMDRRTNSEDAMHKGNKVPKEKALQILQINDVINQDKIRTVFQPVVSIKTREVVGYEALLRGPQGTKIENPEVFFSLAKEADVVRELDLLCVRHALQNIKKLSENQMLFINIKPITLENIKALQLIFELLKLKRAQWKRAIFEIPESGVYSLSQDAMSGLKYLRDLGAKVAIDDAGSGITSLRDILSVKPDVIKIDMSLIRNIHNDKDRQNILESLMRFARCLGAKAVAEGIETKEEYKYLLKQNVLYGQGYFFARPAPSMIRSIPKNKI